MQNSGTATEVPKPSRCVGLDHLWWIFTSSCSPFFPGGRKSVAPQENHHYCEKWLRTATKYGTPPAEIWDTTCCIPANLANILNTNPELTLWKVTEKTTKVGKNGCGASIIQVLNIHIAQTQTSNKQQPTPQHTVVLVCGGGGNSATVE